MDGSKYCPDSLFDTAMCIGASFIYGNYTKTLEALRSMVLPNGLIVTGEPFWIKEPDPEYLRQAGLKKEDFHDDLKAIITVGDLYEMCDGPGTQIVFT